ncbi:hypothetical protein [Fodinicurvata fenggangensis]|uniref:hypothetical protein n=1 Tax=Fodinicurvata fenggangensis TaxID=1121830 RepID=UPI000478ECC7|nr:hypothetical protein [Fodinicurvata fenggangensis]
MTEQFENKGFSPVSRTGQELRIDEALHWAVARERADQALKYLRTGPQDFRPGVSADGCWAVERYSVLGTFVDGTGSSDRHGPQVHPDAETLWLTADRVLERPSLLLVQEAARNGAAPDWGRDLPVVRMKAKRVFDRKRNVMRVQEMTAPKSKARYCVLELEDNGAEIGRRRIIYRMWWQALRTLQAEVEQKALRRLVLKPFDLPERPWEEDPLSARENRMRRIA